MTVQKSEVTIRDENALNNHLHSMRNVEGIALIWYNPNMNVTVHEN